MTALDTLGWAIVHATWQAALVAAMLGGFLSVGRPSARLRYVTAFGALLMVVALAVITGVVLSMASIDGSAGGRSVSSTGMAAPVNPFFRIAAALAPAMTWLALGWLAAVAVLLVRWGGGWLVVAKLTSRATRPARPAWTASLRSAAARIGVRAPVELRESASIDTPTLIGHRRPVILVPIPAFEALATAEAESVLAHELAHVRRGDFAANSVQTVVEILFFFHPAVRWLSRRVREERELCCDDLAVEAAGSRVVYGRALAHLEQLRSSFGARRLALGANGGALLRRIERLADATTTSGRNTMSSRLMLMLAVAATLASVATAGFVVLPPTLHARVANAMPERYTVRAHDPAGEFTITFERGQPSRATIDGIAVTGDQLISRGDSLFLPWGEARLFAVRLNRNGFTWTPRSP